MTKPSNTENSNIQNKSWRKILRNFLIELLIYSVLVIGYFFLVLRVLSTPLQKLFQENLTYYAFAGLALIIAQGVLLEIITSFLLERLGLQKRE